MNKKVTIILVILNIALMVLCIKFVIENNKYREDLKNDDETIINMREEGINNIKELDKEISELEAKINR